MDGLISKYGSIDSAMKQKFIFSHRIEHRCKQTYLGDLKYGQKILFVFFNLFRTFIVNL